MFSLPQLDPVQLVGGLILAASAAFAAWQRGWIKAPTLRQLSGSPEKVAPEEAPVPAANALGAALVIAQYAQQNQIDELKVAAAEAAFSILYPSAPRSAKDSPDGEGEE